jgi:hypothetical protein
VHGDLGRGLLHPDLGAEVDGQLVGGLARLGERLGVQHPTDADIDLHEVVEADRGGDGRTSVELGGLDALCGWPSGPTTIFSTRSWAAFRRFSQCAFRRAPSSYRAIDSSSGAWPDSSFWTICLEALQRVLEAQIGGDRSVGHRASTDEPLP